MTRKEPAPIAVPTVDMIGNVMILQDANGGRWSASLYERAMMTRIAELEARNRALEDLLRRAGFSDAQIKAGTPYVEVMGS